MLNNFLNTYYKMLEAIDTVHVLAPLVPAPPREQILHELSLL